MTKKGALELSVNTIVVVVIGITLLVLGLVFVRNMFGNIESLTKDAFTRAKAEIRTSSNVNQLLTISPDNIKIEQGSADVVNVIVANLEEDPASFYLEATGSDEKIDCSFADTMTTKSLDYTLSSGEQASINLIADEKKGPLRMASCNINIIGDFTGDRNDQVIVEVIKKSGILG